MVMAVELSARKGLLTPADVDRFTALLERYRLPTRVSFDRNSVKDALTKDKKREGDHIQFILLNGIGDCLIRDISLAELDSALETLHPGNGKRV
jgi:3-dehydroquinate synthase